MLYSKIDPRAKDLIKAHEGDAGWDLTAIETSIKGNVLTVRTGISLGVPPGTVGLLFPRSSICKYDLMMLNSVGVIDSGYTGEILVNFLILNKEGKLYTPGDRIAQIVLVPLATSRMVSMEEYTAISTRCNGGFGSSGT